MDLVVTEELYTALLWRGKPCSINKVGRYGGRVAAAWLTLQNGTEIVYIGKNAKDFAAIRTEPDASGHRACGDHHPP